MNGILAFLQRIQKLYGKIGRLAVEHDLKHLLITLFGRLATYLRLAATANALGILAVSPFV